MNSSCIRSVSSLSVDATTSAVGTSIDTSSAWLGPDSAAIFVFGNSSFTTSSNVFSVSFSNPFEHITIL